MDINLLVDAGLRRALVEPGGSLLHTAKDGEPGLFPLSALGKRAAAKALREGYLESAPEVSGEAARITSKGQERIAQNLCPKTILDDFVRILEHRQIVAKQMFSAAQKQMEQLDRMQLGLTELRLAILKRDALVELTPMVEPAPLESSFGEIALTKVRQILANHEREFETDYLLFQLYDRLTEQLGPFSIGVFHDLLRVWHGEGFVALHPWTGPLYQLPRPEVALLTGHEIACYARWSAHLDPTPAASNDSKSNDPKSKSTETRIARSLVG